MTDHPLTNEDCKQILIDVSDSWDPEFEWYPDLRAAYDLGESKRVQHLQNKIAELEAEVKHLKEELEYCYKGDQ